VAMPLLSPTNSFVNDLLPLGLVLISAARHCPHALLRADSMARVTDFMQQLVRSHSRRLTWGCRVQHGPAVLHARFGLAC